MPSSEVYEVRLGLSLSFHEVWLQGVTYENT